MNYDDELSKIDNKIFEKQRLLHFHKMEINSSFGFGVTIHQKLNKHQDEIYKLKKELKTLLKQKLRVKKLIRIIED